MIKQVEKSLLFISLEANNPRRGSTHKKKSNGMWHASSVFVINILTIQVTLLQFDILECYIHKLVEKFGSRI